MSEVMDPLSNKVARTVGNSVASNRGSKGRAAAISRVPNKGNGNGRVDHRVSNGISIQAINRALTTISLQADPVSRAITL